MPRKKTMSFEDNLAQLEQIVNKLESGDANLSDVLADYSAGIELSQKCLEELKAAEAQIDVLLRTTGGSIQEDELVIEEV